MTERLAKALQLQAPTNAESTEDSSSRSAVAAARPVSARDVTTEPAPKEKTGLLKSAKSKLDPKAEVQSKATNDNVADGNEAKDSKVLAEDPKPATPAPVPASQNAEQSESKK